MITPPAGHVFVCLHRGTGWISRLIQWQQRGPYSHASLVLPDGSHVEAREFEGVNRHRKFTAPKGEAVDVFLVPVGYDGLDRIERRAQAETGARYDYRAVWSFLTRTTPKGASAEKWFCSELVFALVQEEGGVRLLRDTQAWEVSPPLLARAPALEFARTVIASGLPLAA